MKLRIEYISKKTEEHKEFVKIKVLEDKTYLGDFAIIDLTFDADGKISNKFRHLYRFPNGIVNKGDDIFLYSEEGDYGNHENPNGTYTHKFYWNVEGNIWNSDLDQATLIIYKEIQKITVGEQS